MIDWLTYRSYEAQRINSPNIKYQRWGILFANIEHLETIYQGMKYMAQLESFTGKTGKAFSKFMKGYEVIVYEFAEALDMGWDDAEKFVIRVINNDLAHTDKLEKEGAFRSI